jgi:glycosyltransferase involved in cell wall biosynthesis
MSPDVPVPTCAPLRVTAVMTHPIQYFSPWFRWITANLPDVDLTVLYAAVPRAEQQGRAFGEVFEWDSRPLDGYRYEVCVSPDGLTFTDDTFWGLDVADVGDRIARTRPDVVLIAGWHSAFQVRALLACRRRGLPAIYRGDSCLPMAPTGWRRPLWWMRTWLLLRLFRGWLSVGTRADEYLRHFSVPAGRVAASPHCADHDWFAAHASVARADGGRERLRVALGLREDDFVVLFAGRLMQRKRPLDALRGLVGLGPSAVLLVVGTGPMMEALQVEARRLGVRTVMAGFRNQRGMADCYAASDVLAVPSAWESWGLVVNEALASGIPCVVSADVAAGTDLIRDGENGFSVPVGDVEAIRGALGAVREGLASGRYDAPTCQKPVMTRGFREASAGLLTLGRRLARGAPGTPQSLYRD